MQIFKQFANIITNILIKQRVLTHILCRKKGPTQYYNITLKERKTSKKELATITIIAIFY